MWKSFRRDILFACAVGSTVGWTSSTLAFVMAGTANPGVFVGLMLPIILWTAFFLTRMKGAK